MSQTAYAVVRGDGTIKWNKSRGLAIYAGKSVAQGQCREHGDCVVQVEIDLSKEPLFIRSKKMKVTDE